MAPQVPHPLVRSGSSETTETTRHLLAPSAAPSILETSSGVSTPRARSPARIVREGQSVNDVDNEEQQQSASSTYRGFPSQAAYLAALSEWAESKKYLQTDTQLTGWYGVTTMDQYVARRPQKPKTGLGLRARLLKRKAKAGNDVDSEDRVGQ